MNKADLLSQVQSGTDLSLSESVLCLSQILEGKWALSETGSLLSMLKNKGESVSEIVGFAQVLRRHMQVVPGISNAIDLCGTGGGPAHRYNVSTASAFVLAYMGVGVAKHGNRGSREPNGSFDFLEALGVPLLTDPDSLLKSFRAFNLCFLYARAHHPIVAKVADARKQISGPTIFNLIGPLCNPGNAQKQVLGVSNPALGMRMAEAASQLGQTDTLVVSGEEGYDEVTPFGKTQLWRMSAAGLSTQTVGMSDAWACTSDALRVRDRHHAVAETHLAFSGERTPIARYIAINTGAALYLLGRSGSLEEGADVAMACLRSGKVRDFLTDYIAFVVAHAG